MNTHSKPDIEVISVLPTGPARKTPLLFVHGAYAGAWLWQEYYLPFFAERGWSAHALSLSGHGESRGRDHLDAFSIENYVDDVREVASMLPVRPVLIGHSMGGMVVQKFLEHEDVPGAVLMAAVPPRGLMSASFGLLMQRPKLVFELNSVLSGGLPDLNTVRDALFHGPVAPQRLREIAARCQPESMRALWDMTLFNLPNAARMRRPPMLVLGAEHDRLIPISEVQHTAEVYGLRAEIFADMGHGMMLEDNWREPAERIALWLEDQGF
ncbi:MAG: hydrolase [Rhodocyclales bacterium]|nr:hydrolase [Rhodocyclales bacterium]